MALTKEIEDTLRKAGYHFVQDYLSNASVLASHKKLRQVYKNKGKPSSHLLTTIKDSTLIMYNSFYYNGNLVLYLEVMLSFNDKNKNHPCIDINCGVSMDDSYINYH